MESVQNQVSSNTFLAYLLDCVCKTPAAELKEEVSTIYGDIISQRAIDAALKTGKGLMIGGFFVGATHQSDMAFGDSFFL